MAYPYIQVGVVMHDLVIRDGLVVDGTGTSAYNADVAVDDGVISEVGTVSGSGREEIDAAGASNKV